MQPPIDPQYPVQPPPPGQPGPPAGYAPTPPSYGSGAPQDPGFGQQAGAYGQQIPAQGGFGPPPGAFPPPGMYGPPPNKKAWLIWVIIASVLVLLAVVVGVVLLVSDRDDESGTKGDKKESSENKKEKETPTPTEDEEEESDAGLSFDLPSGFTVKGTETDPVDDKAVTTLENSVGDAITMTHYSTPGDGAEALAAWKKTIAEDPETSQIQFEEFTLSIPSFAGGFKAVSGSAAVYVFADRNNLMVVQTSDAGAIAAVEKVVKSITFDR